MALTLAFYLARKCILFTFSPLLSFVLSCLSSSCIVISFPFGPMLLPLWLSGPTYYRVTLHRMIVFMSEPASQPANVSTVERNAMSNGPAQRENEKDKWFEWDSFFICLGLRNDIKQTKTRGRTILDNEDKSFAVAFVLHVSTATVMVANDDGVGDGGWNQRKRAKEYIVRKVYVHSLLFDCVFSFQSAIHNISVSIILIQCLCIEFQSVIVTYSSIWPKFLYHHFPSLLPFKCHINFIVCWYFLKHKNTLLESGLRKSRTNYCVNCRCASGTTTESYDWLLKRNYTKFFDMKPKEKPTENNNKKGKQIKIFMSTHGCMDAVS